MVSCISLGVLLVLALQGGAGAGEVVVQVTTEKGAPVPGAEVFVGGWPMMRLVANGHGVARFPVPAANGLPLNVVAAAPGRAPAGLRLAPGTTGPVVLRLPPGRVLAGRVLSSEGTPAAGVRVRLMAVTGVSIPELDRWGTRTDAGGWYRLTGVPSVGGVVTFEDPRFQWHHAEIQFMPTVVRLARIYPLRLRGRLVDPAGDPRDWTVQAGGSTAVPRADGTFEMSLRSAGQTLVEAAHHEGKRLVIPVRVALGPRAPEAEVELRAIAGGVIRGRAVDAVTHRPLGQVALLVQPSQVGSRWIPPLTTRADGSFEVRVPPGTARIAYYAGSDSIGYRFGTPVEVTVSDGGQVEVEVPIPGLDGVVVDEEGRPVEGAVVAVQGSISRVTTGKDGTFRFNGATDLEVVLTAWYGEKGLVEPLVLKPPLPAQVRLALGPVPEVMLVGRVTDDRGRPAQGVRVRIRHWVPIRPGSHDGRVADTAIAETDAQGYYRLSVRDLSGSYHAGLEKGVHRFLGGGELTKGAGPERRFSDIRFVSECASVAGRVVDARGRPVGSATVFWVSGLARHRATTDQAGRFRIEGMPDRPVLLGARHPTWGGAFARATPGSPTHLQLKP